MKRSILLLFVVFGLTTGWAQAPYQFNFQAVARNLAGNPMTNTTVDFRLSIVQGDPDGAVVYIETQSTQTNNFGLANLLVGSGVADLGNLATLDWMSGPYFLRIELADNDGNYLLVGSSPLMSVPYALHAKTSEQAGPQGPPGEQGLQGENGMSAYEVWLSLGNEGTVAEFLNSLKGESGAQGAQGPAGQDGVGIFTTITNDNGSFTLVFTDGSSYTTPSLVGPQGAQGPQGEPGSTGPQGEQGAVGTDGASAYETWLSLGNSGSEADFIASLTGPQGEQGVDGLSAYEVWLSVGNEGSEEEFLDSLIGSSSVINHGEWLFQNSDAVFNVPNGIHSLILETNGARGGNGASASGTMNWGAMCYPQAGQGGSAYSGSFLILNLTEGDTITVSIPQNGENNTNSVYCQTCGSGCSWGCTGGQGTSGGDLLVFLNGELIVEISGGQGGFGAYAGTPQCANGANGGNGFLSYKANYCIEVQSDSEASGIPFVKAIF